MRFLVSAVRALADLVLPTSCAGCLVGAGLWCDACAAQLSAPARCTWPQPAPADLPEPYAIAAYSGPLRAAIIAHKERGRTALARPLGQALARSARAAVEASAEEATGWGSPVYVVPAPSRPAALRERGEDAMLRMARVAVRSLRRQGLDASVVAALRVRPGAPVRDSAGLSAAERAANLTGSMVVAPRWRGALAGRRVLLVDDVVTTGSTLAEAARVLRAAGAAVPAAAVVAATTRRGVSPRPSRD